MIDKFGFLSHSFWLTFNVFFLALRSVVLLLQGSRELETVGKKLNKNSVALDNANLHSRF